MTHYTSLSLPPRIVWEPIVRAALLEDLGRAGDRTTDAVVPADALASAKLVARAGGIVAGLEVAAAAFRLLDERVEIEFRAKDGQTVGPMTTLAIASGPARAILSGERVALNFLGRMCGIATASGRFVALLEGTGAHITCTRKTTPGLRVFEKYAVRAGGGHNHRFGLDDAVLIKDNHVALAGGARAAVLLARDAVGHMISIELEVDTLDQLSEVLDLPLDAVLLDNMDPATLREAVSMVAGRFATEASGGITLETARAVAETGVGYLSSGWLTHSAPTLDVALDIVVDDVGPATDQGRHTGLPLQPPDHRPRPPPQPHRLQEGRERHRPERDEESRVGLPGRRKRARVHQVDPTEE